MLNTTMNSAVTQSRKEEIEEELQELSYTYKVQLSDKTREAVDKEVKNSTSEPFLLPGPLACLPSIVSDSCNTSV